MSEHSLSRTPHPSNDVRDGLSEPIRTGVSCRLRPHPDSIPPDSDPAGGLVCRPTPPNPSGSTHSSRDHPRFFPTGPGSTVQKSSVHPTRSPDPSPEDLCREPLSSGSSRTDETLEGPGVSSLSQRFNPRLRTTTPTFPPTETDESGARRPAPREGVRG